VTALDAPASAPATVERSPLDGVVPYPPDVARRYRALGYWTGTTHDELLRAAVAQAPDRPAVVAGDVRWTYAELDRAVERLAAGLVAEGLRPGDRVVVQLPNVAAYVQVVFALWRAGAVPVLALPAHRRSEIEHFSRQSGAIGYITCGRHDGFDHAELAAELGLPLTVVAAAEAPAPARTLASVEAAGVAAAPLPRAAAAPGDVALLQLSGGSTGTPKLIPRTHDDYLYSVRESARICGLDARSVLLLALPAAHNFAMSSPGLLGAVSAHATVVLTTDPSAPSVFGLVARERVTILPAVPPLAQAWLDAPERATADLASLALLQVGGARLAATVARRVRPELGCALQQVFGMAEGLVNYTRLDDDAETVEQTQGLRISPHDEVLVVDEQDRPVPPGTPGQLLTRGPYTIRGYLGAPEHDRRAFTADGFYRTGDVVVERADGYLTVVGRVKDQINRGGEKIAPQEVEEHILAHPGITDASVVGIPDGVLGERVRAFVVPRGGAELRPVDVRRHLRGRGLATYKVPDEIVVCSELPATPVGKIDRRSLTGAEERG
jgi:2,3-dihydroxybenzoate-AMP ligase